MHEIYEIWSYLDYNLANLCLRLHLRFIYLELVALVVQKWTLCLEAYSPIRLSSEAEIKCGRWKELSLALYVIILWIPIRNPFSKPKNKHKFILHKLMIQKSDK